MIGFTIMQEITGSFFFIPFFSNITYTFWVLSGNEECVTGFLSVIQESTGSVFTSCFGIVAFGVAFSDKFKAATKI